MKRCYDYIIIPTVEGIPVFVINSTKLKISSPVLLYDGGEHAILFANERKCDEAYKLQLTGRNIDLAETEAILVDYINEKTQKSLRNCNWCVFMEKDKLDDDDAVRDYKVIVRHINKNYITNRIKK